MNTVNLSLFHRSSEVETRIFRRGVTDQEVRQAIALVYEYVATHLHQSGDEIDGWTAFSEVYDDLSRNFTTQQTLALEIATESILSGFGCLSWSGVREALRRAARTASGQQNVA